MVINIVGLCIADAFLLFKFLFNLYYVLFWKGFLLSCNLCVQNWKDEDDEDDPSSSRGTSWFKKQYSAKGSKRDQTGNRGPKHWSRSKYISSALVLKEALHIWLQNHIYEKLILTYYGDLLNGGGRWGRSPIDGPKGAFCLWRSLLYFFNVIILLAYVYHACTFHKQ